MKGPNKIMGFILSVSQTQKLIKTKWMFDKLVGFIELFSCRMIESVSLIHRFYKEGSVEKF